MSWYQAKVYPAGRGRDVYRVMVFNGADDYQQVCGRILDAFDFDFDHLFLFNSARGNPYDGGIDGNDFGSFETLLQFFGPKFIMLYDFGDDWVFNITVQKVLPEKPAQTVLKSKGKIRQYPSWDDDDEDWEDEEE